jgi:cytochrome P450
MPFFKKTELSHKLDQYHEFIQELIKLKKEELKNGSLNSKRDLISALIKSNESSEENKLTMEEIRVDNFLFYFDI